jgi:hypothetical protein
LVIHRGLGAGSINQENDENPIPTPDPPKYLNSDNDNDNGIGPWKFRSLKAWQTVRVDPTAFHTAW